MIPDSLTPWLPDSLTVWLPDSLTPWLPDSLTIWHPDYLTIWQSDYLTLWLSYSLTPWLSDYMTIWLPDILTPWLSDYLTIWLSYSLTIWLPDSCSPIPAPRFTRPERECSPFHPVLHPMYIVQCSVQCSVQCTSQCTVYCTPNSVLHTVQCTVLCIIVEYGAVVLPFRSCGSGYVLTSSVRRQAYRGDNMGETYPSLLYKIWVVRYLSLFSFCTLKTNCSAWPSSNKSRSWVYIFFFTTHHLDGLFKNFTFLIFCNRSEVITLCYTLG